jgi:hypothetical protein
VPEADLAGALEAGPSCLHADDVGKRDLEHIAALSTHLVSGLASQPASAADGTSMTPGGHRVRNRTADPPHRAPTRRRRILACEGGRVLSDDDHHRTVAPDATDADLGAALRQVIARELARR